FVARLTAHYERSLLRLTPDVEDLLRRYRWPGNVGELWSVLERLVVLARGDAITVDTLPDRLRKPQQAAVAAVAVPQLLSLHELERREIEIALRECATLEDAANRLGINPTTLWRKRKRYGLA